MNLALDIGNNYFKIGIYKNSDLIYFFSDSNSKIDSAMTRIDDGSYGYCEETGDPINLKSLEASPKAT